MATAHQESPGLGRESLAGIKVIDVDTHLSEPCTLWTDRAPAKWKERVPQVKTVDNKRQWVIGGTTVMGPVAAISVVKPEGEKSRGIDFSLRTGRRPCRLIRRKGAASVHGR
jgi:hypothetical protein